MAPKGRVSKKDASNYDWSKFKFTPKHIQNVATIFAGDIVAISCGILIIGYFYNVAKGFCGSFVSMSHNVTAPSDQKNGPPVMYIVGIFDITFLMFASALAYVIHDCFRELIWERISRKFFGGKRLEALKFELNMTFAVFCASMVPFAWMLLRESGSLGNMALLWEGYPHEKMPTYLKMFYMVNIGYWIHAIAMIYLWAGIKSRGNSKVEQDRIVTCAIQLSWIMACYYFHFVQFGVLALFVHYMAESVRIVHVCLASVALSIAESGGKEKKTWFSKSGNGIPPLKSVVDVFATIAVPLGWFSRICVIALAVKVFGMGFPSLAQAENNPDDYNTAAVRALMLGTTIASQILPVLTTILNKKGKVETKTD